MHPFFPDRYSRLSSPVHRLGVPIKLAALFSLLVGIVLMPPSFWVAYILIGAFLFAVAVASRVPFLFLMRRLLLLEFLTAGIAFLSLLQPGGVSAFTFILTRSTLSLFAVLLFSNTTPFSDLLTVLRTWRFPPLALTLLALMYRYLFLLVDEAGRMRRARASRTFQKRRRLDWTSLATVVAQLFIRSAERADRTYSAMCARGWR
jgi:cobalt/nickel transport system permease protein